MNIKHPLLLVTSVAGLLVTLSACTNLVSSRDVANPEVPAKVVAAQVCSNCHGITGESASPAFPKLAGQQKDYLVAQLTDFKGHERSDSRGTQYMWGFTHLSAAQVDGLADYFSSQAPMRGKTVAGTSLARGEDIFRNGIAENGVVACATCHGPEANGNGPFPHLAGQHLSYLVEQIKVFKNTDQRPRGAAMKQVTHALSEVDMVAVAQYLESLGAK